MTKIYNTTSPELVNNILSMPTVGMMLAWYREALDIASRKNNETIADFAREIASLWCEQNSGVRIQVVGI